VWQFVEYLSGMPWVAAKYGDALITELNGLFEVEGIPTLLLVSPTGTVLCKDARARVDTEPEGYPWPKKPVEVRACVGPRECGPAGACVCARCVCLVCVLGVCVLGVCAWCVCLVCVLGVCALCVCLVRVLGVYAWCVCLVCVLGVCAWCVCVARPASCLAGVCAWCVCFVCVLGVCVCRTPGFLFGRRVCSV
jgi:hypothetical protein